VVFEFIKPLAKDCSLSVDFQLEASAMRNLSLVVVGLTAVTLAAPAFARVHNHPRHVVQTAFDAVGAPQFVRVGPNG
jgi:hypothetical protein